MRSTGNIQLYSAVVKLWCGIALGDCLMRWILMKYTVRIIKSLEHLKNLKISRVPELGPSSVNYAKH
jgi:hypothetical protein